MGRTNPKEQEPNASEEKKKIAKRNRRAGARFERKIADLFGGQRTGIFGKEDLRIEIEGRDWLIEIKSRKNLAIHTLFKQLHKYNDTAERKTKYKALVIRATGYGDSGTYACIPLGVFLQLIGREEEDGRA